MTQELPPREGLPRSPPPLSDPDLVDENPGSYLAELGTGKSSVAWGLANLAGTTMLGFGALAAGLDEKSEWFVLARLAWCVLPLSSLILFIVTAWQLGTAYTRKPPARVILSVACALASLALWCWLTFERDVLASSSLFLPDRKPL